MLTLYFRVWITFKYIDRNSFLFSAAHKHKTTFISIYISLFMAALLVVTGLFCENNQINKSLEKLHIHKTHRLMRIHCKKEDETEQEKGIFRHYRMLCGFGFLELLNWWMECGWR